MKKYLASLFLFLSLLPIALPAQLLKSDKEKILNMAMNHQREAINDLTELEDICWYIPDLTKREHLSTLIVSCFAAAPQDIRGKFVTVGLSLIASLADNMYSRYSAMRSLLVSAAYHFEMANFYNHLSLGFKECTTYECTKQQDLGTECFLRAIDYLTLCDMLCYCIEDVWVRRRISEYLIEYRDLMLKQFDNPPGKLYGKLSDLGYTLLENMGEILAECQDDALREDIPTYLEEMIFELQNAERHWGIR